MISTIEPLLSQSYDCLILTHPQIQILGGVSYDLQSKGIVNINISKELSSELMTVSAAERSRFSQEWLKNAVAKIHESPVLCSSIDLLFHPALNIDPFLLFRQVARIKQVIVLWPGEYSSNTLSYAVPEHHHYRAWKLSNSLLLQPKVLIHSISVSQGA